MSSGSIHRLRENFKSHLNHWESTLLSNESQDNMLTEIQQWTKTVQEDINQQIHIITCDFNDFQLTGEYSQSVSEGFENLNRLMKKKMDLTQLATGDNIEEILQKCQIYYHERLTPLLNILSKLENEYISIATQMITEKGKHIRKLDKLIKQLYLERESVKNQFIRFNRKHKFLQISKHIKKLELERKLVRLTLHHDRLNLYYFTHDRPPELKEIKNKTDQMRLALLKLEEERHVGT